MAEAEASAVLSVFDKLLILLIFLLVLQNLPSVLSFLYSWRETIQAISAVASAAAVLLLVYDRSRDRSDLGVKSYRYDVRYEFTAMERVSLPRYLFSICNSGRVEAPDVTAKFAIKNWVNGRYDSNPEFVDWIPSGHEDYPRPEISRTFNFRRNHMAILAIPLGRMSGTRGVLALEIQGGSDLRVFHYPYRRITPRNEADCPIQISSPTISNVLFQIRRVLWMLRRIN